MWEPHGQAAGGPPEHALMALGCLLLSRGRSTSSVLAEAQEQANCLEPNCWLGLEPPR